MQAPPIKAKYIAFRSLLYLFLYHCNNSSGEQRLSSLWRNLRLLTTMQAVAKHPTKKSQMGTILGSKSCQRYKPYENNARINAPMQSPLFACDRLSPLIFSKHSSRLRLYKSSSFIMPQTNWLSFSLFRLAGVFKSLPIYIDFLRPKYSLSLIFGVFDKSFSHGNAHASVAVRSL